MKPTGVLWWAAFAVCWAGMFVLILIRQAVKTK